MPTDKLRAVAHCVVPRFCFTSLPILCFGYKIEKY